MMSRGTLALILCILVEIVGFAIFDYLRKSLPKSTPAATTAAQSSGPSELVKGLMERLLLVAGYALSLGFIVVAFCTLKMASRLSNTEAFSGEKVTPDVIEKRNGYFLMGNFASILMSFAHFAVILYVLEWRPR